MSLFNKHKKVEATSSNTIDRFIEVYAIVKGKMANKMPMMTAEEELMENLVMEWREIFPDIQ